MESSPLTQQTRPETFQPKIVKLYETLLFVRYFLASKMMVLSMAVLTYCSRTQTMLTQLRVFGGSFSSFSQIGRICRK